MKRNTFIEYYDEAKTKIKTRFSLDEKKRLSGLVEHFRQNGNYAEKSRWLNGKRHGITALYAPNGQCYMRYLYNYGHLIKKTTLNNPKREKNNTNF